VRVAVPAGERLEASARTYLLPVAGSLLGAAAADVLAGALHPALAGGNAAGLGGIAGALLGLYFGRKPRRRAAAGASPPPRITRILAAVDSPANRD
jgi:membrane associated rhomboid family serine protease